MPMRSVGLWPTEKWLLTGCHPDSRALEPSTEAVLWKMPRLYVKDSFPNLLWGAGPALVLSRDRSWWARTFCSYSTLLKLVGIISFFFHFLFLFSFFVLFYFFLPSFPSFGGCHFCTPFMPHSSQWIPSPCFPTAGLLSTSISYRGTYTHIWCFVFVDAMQTIPLDYLALVSMETCIPGSHGCVTIGETVLDRLPHTEHCIDSRLKYTPSILWKRLTCSFWSFSIRGRLQIWHTFRDYRDAFRECRLRDTIFLLFLCLLTAHWYLP